MRLLLLFTCTFLCTSCIAPRGEGLNYIAYYLLYLAPILLFKAIYLVSKEKYINNKLKPSYRGFNFNRYRTVIVATSSVFFSIVIVNLIPSKNYDSPYEQFKYEIRAKKHQEAFNTYRRHLTKTEDNLAFLKACYTFINNENIPSLEDFAYYVEDFEEKSKLINQHTYFRLALIGLMNKNHSRFWKGIDHLTEADKGFHFLNGIYHRNNKNYRKAQISYEASIRKGEMKEEALKELSELHHYIHDKQSLLKLIELDPEIKTISPSIAREYFYQIQDWPNYYKAMLRQYFSNINFFGLLGGCIIALCWFLYFRKINPFYSISWTNSIAIFVLSLMVTHLFCFPLYDFHEYTLGIQYYVPQNTFEYAFLRVGLIEEIIKIIPLLFAYWLLDDFEDSYSFIYYAALSGLAFSFEENFAIYFTADRIDLIQIRAMYSTTGHIFFSCLVGYSMYLAKHYKYPMLLGIFGGLILAIIAHGAYDFIIFINSKKYGWEPNIVKQIGFYILFLACIHILSRMINNSLNMSKQFDWKKLKNYSDISFQFTIALVFIVLAEYFILSIAYGKEIANDHLAGGFFNTLMIISFISLSLGKFDFFRGLLSHNYIPWSIEKILSPPDRSGITYVGKKIRMIPNSNSYKADYTRSGEIVARRYIDHDSNYYVVKLAQDLDYRDINQRYVLIEIFDDEIELEKIENCQIKIHFIRTGSSLQELNLKSNIIDSSINAHIV